MSFRNRIEDVIDDLGYFNELLGDHLGADPFEMNVNGVSPVEAAIKLLKEILEEGE